MSQYGGQAKMAPQTKRRLSGAWTLIILLLLALLVALPVVLSIHASAQRASLQNTQSASDEGPLDIRLIGVRPDGGDKLFGADGKRIGEIDDSLKYGPLESASWGQDKQRRDFIFELEGSDKPILLAPFLLIRPAGTTRAMSSSQYKWVLDAGEKKVILFQVTFPRSYSQTINWWQRFLPFLPSARRQIQVKRVDLALRYYHGPRGKADFSFTGPFIPRKKVSADGGLPYELIPQRGGLWGEVSSQFHLSTKLRFDADTPTLAYDTSSKRYLVSERSGSWGSAGAELDYAIRGVPLEKVVSIVFGEKPFEKTFRNITVAYRGRPARDHAPYLDRMSTVLELSELPMEKLAGYTFSDAQEAIKVIDIVRGVHILRAWDTINYTRPKVDFAKLGPEVAQKLRRTAAAWAKTVDPRIRAAGVGMGLDGKWPEFVTPALALLDVQDRRVRSKVADALLHYSRYFSPDEVWLVKEALLGKNDPATFNSLMWCLERNDTPPTTEALWELARCDRPRLWWRAIQKLAARDEFSPRPSLSAMLELRLILVMGPSWARNRKELLDQAHQLLPGLLSAETARMNPDVFLEVLKLVIERLDRASATLAMVNFLRGVTDYQRSAWAIDKVVKQINLRHDVNIGRLGSDPAQWYASCRHLFDWPGIAADTIIWCETGKDPAEIPPGHRAKPGDLRIVWRNRQDPERSAIDVWICPGSYVRPRKSWLRHGNDFIAYQIEPDFRREGRRLYEVHLSTGVLDKSSQGRNHLVDAATLPARLAAENDKEVLIHSSSQSRSKSDWEVWVEALDAPQSVLSETQLFKDWWEKCTTSGFQPTAVPEAVEAPGEWPVRAEVVNLHKLSDEAREALRSARSCDYAYVPVSRGNQEEAIAAYKQYLALAPKDDASLILAPMCRICYLYANTYDTEKGERYDFEAASDWCRRVLELADKEGIVSVEVTDLRKLYMSSTLDRLERVRRIAENYNWHKKITPEDIERNFARCDKYGRYIGDNPGLRSSFPEASRRQFSKMVNSVKTRCLEKIEETITYAKRLAVIEAIERAFTESNLGPELWKKLQDRKRELSAPSD